MKAYSHNPPPPQTSLLKRLSLDYIQAERKEPGDRVKNIKVRKMDFEFSLKILEPKYLFTQIERDFRALL